MFARMTCRARAVRDGLVFAGVLFAAASWWQVVSAGDAIDAYAYWQVNGVAPYAVPAGAQDSFHYSPAVAQLFSLFGGLPFVVFLGAWTALLIGLILWLVPPRWWWLAVVLAAEELKVGNVHLIIAAATVLAFTRSAAFWSVPLLLKVTPAIGVLWPLFRRDWRALTAAGAATAAIVFVSLPFGPGLWPEWIAYITEASGRDLGGPQIMISLWVRVAVASAVVAYAARTDRVWLVPIAVMLSLPSLWYLSGFVILYAIPRLRKAGQESAAAPSVDVTGHVGAAGRITCGAKA